MLLPRGGGYAQGEKWGGGVSVVRGGAKRGGGWVSWGGGGGYSIHVNATCEFGGG